MADYGRVPLQKEVSPDGFGIGAWASSQRRRLESLTELQVRQLEDTPGWRWAETAQPEAEAA